LQPIEYVEIRVTVVPSRAGQDPPYRFRGSARMRKTLALMAERRHDSFGRRYEGRNAVVESAQCARVGTDCGGALVSKQGGAVGDDVEERD